MSRVYLEVAEVLAIHKMVIEHSGGLGACETADFLSPQFSVLRPDTMPM